MKSFFRRMICSMFCILMILLSITANFVSAGTSVNVTPDGFVYEIADGEVTITGYTGTSTEVTFPEEVDGYPVTKLAEEVISWNEEICKIVIPDTVKTIEQKSFYCSFFVEDVYIGSGVESIGEDAFYGCEVKAYTVSEDNQFFSSIDGILCNKAQDTIIKYPIAKEETVVVIPDGIKAIPDEFLIYNNRVTKVVVPDSVTSIGRDAFVNCENLKEINFPEGLTCIGNTAFYGCKKLSKIDIPSTVTSIGERAFANCVLIEAVTLPVGLKKIEKGTFYACHKLVDVKIPYGVEVIGENAFRKCIELKEIIIPNSVTEIEKRAFYDCEKLENVSLSRNLTSLSEELFYSCKLREVYVPDSVTEICRGAFWACYSLTDIYIPPTVKELGSVPLPLSASHVVRVYGFEGTVAEAYVYDNMYYSAFVSLGDVSEYVPLPKLGDVNMDSVVNIKDSTAIQKALADLIVLDEISLYSADYDGDTYINIKDATLIQKKLAGII